MDQGNVKASAGAAIRSRSRRAKTEGTNREMKGLSRRLSLGSKRTAVVQIISSQVQSARQAARQSLDSFSTGPLFEENDLARIEDALFQAHLTGKSAVKAITDDLKEIEGGLHANDLGGRRRSARLRAANLGHLSDNETKKKIKDLVAQIEKRELDEFSSRTGLPVELADAGEKDYAFDNGSINYLLHNQMPCENVASHFPEIKRAQMVDWIFWISRRVVEISDELFFLAVHLLDKALVVSKNISEMSDVENRIVKVAAVKIAGRFEFGPEYEDGMCDRLKSVCIVCKYKLRCQEDKFGDWGTQLLKFVDFVISRKHLLHFLRIFWRLMGDVMSETEKENGWVTVKGLAYIAMTQAPLMNNKPSLVAAAIMRIALHLFFNRGQLPEDKVLEVISSLLHEESQYVPIATKLLDWVLSGKMTSIPKIIRVFEANQYHPSKQELEIIAHVLKNYSNFLGRFLRRD